MGKFGPLDTPEPHPKSEELRQLLGLAGVTHDVIDRACELIDDVAAELQWALDKECPVCLDAIANGGTEMPSDEDYMVMAYARGYAHFKPVVDRICKIEQLESEETCKQNGCQHPRSPVRTPND